MKKIIIIGIIVLTFLIFNTTPTDGGISTTRDIDLIARTIYFESRGEPLIGKIGVGFVIMNRIKQMDSSVQNVLKQNQFNYKGKIQDQKSFAECVSIAKDIYKGKFDPDPTEGATFFHAVKKDSPKWASSKGFKQTVRIQNHKFYRFENEDK